MVEGPGHHGHWPEESGRSIVGRQCARRLQGAIVLGLLKQVALEMLNECVCVCVSLSPKGAPLRDLCLSTPLFPFSFSSTSLFREAFFVFLGSCETEQPPPPPSMAPPCHSHPTTPPPDHHLHLLPSSDLVQDGSVDLKGLPVSRSRTGGWKACFFIIGYELIERLAYYGISSNLVTYLTTELHEGTASSAKNVNNWTGVTTVVPIIGAFFADAYWGRYWAIAIVSIIYVLGLILLTLSVSLKTLKPPTCSNHGSVCPKATSAQLGFFFFSLYLISIGTGGVKPCLEALGADQFDEEDPREKRKKSSFFNWWYFGLCTGVLLASTVVVYIQDNVGWGVGFGILAVAMTIAVCLFLAGSPLYRNKIPGGSPLTRIAQVFVAAMCKWNVTVPSDENLLYEMHDKESVRVGRRQLLHTNEFVFFDKAATDESPSGHLHFSSWEHSRVQGEEEAKLAVQSFDGSEIEESYVSKAQRVRPNPWKLCTVTQVEEVKLVVRIIPIWLTMLIYGVAIVQASTLFVKQGSTMETRIGAHFKIPPASLLTFSTIIILILLPVYDRVFVPAARWVTGYERGITLLQRLGVGMFINILCMVAAALTEMKRLKVAKDSGLLDEPNTTLPMSIFWLLPQYLLLGASDVFALVGQQEFFYEQVPDTMRSMGMALYLCANGVGSFLSSFLITIVDKVTSQDGHQSWFVNNLNRSHLDYFYWLLAVLSTLNLGIFILIAYFYTYKKVESAAMRPLYNENSM